MKAQKWEDIPMAEVRHIWEWCAKHRACWNGMTSHVLICQYGENVRCGSTERGGWEKRAGSVAKRLHPRMLS